MTMIVYVIVYFGDCVEKSQKLAYYGMILVMRKPGVAGDKYHCLSYNALYMPLYEPRHEKTRYLPMRKLKRRSAQCEVQIK